MKTMLEDAAVALTNQSQYISFACEVLFADVPKKQAIKYTNDINEAFVDFCKSAWSLEQGGSKKISFTEFKIRVIEILFLEYTEKNKIIRKGVNQIQAEVFIRDLDVFAQTVAQELKRGVETFH
jgi:hypothetical protein